MLRYLTDFAKAVGLFWVGGAFLLLDIVGVASRDWRGLPVWLLALVGLGLLLFGTYRAYAEVAAERDTLKGELESAGARFKIRAGTPHGATFNGRNVVRISDVYLLNRSGKPMQMRFSLVAADSSATLHSDPYDRIWREGGAPPNYFANPTHLDKHSNRTAHLAWIASGDVTQFVIDGTVLRLLEEQSQSRVDIPLPTEGDGFVYPESSMPTT